MKLTGENRSTGGKPCPSATLSTTNPTWTDPCSNPGLRGERPATNRLSRARPTYFSCLTSDRVIVGRLPAAFEFCPLHYPIRLCGPLSPPPGIPSPRLKLTEREADYSHLVPRLKRRWSLSKPSHMTSLHCVQLRIRTTLLFNKELNWSSV
jgi:hypothetical protein